MKYIVNKTSGDKIQGTGLDQINNNVRYERRTSTGEVVTSGLISCPAMWEGMDNSQVEQSDNGLTGREISYNFSTLLLWAYNSLELNQEEWEVQSI